MDEEEGQTGTVLGGPCQACSRNLTPLGSPHGDGSPHPHPVSPASPPSSLSRRRCPCRATVGCSGNGRTRSSHVRYRGPEARGGPCEPAAPPSLSERGAPPPVPHCLTHAQAYPVTIDAGGIAERTVTAQACPARLTHTLAHGAASPVCKEGKAREERHICTCSPACPPGGAALGARLSPATGSHLFLSFLEFPSLHFSSSILPSTFHSADGVITLKHKPRHMSPLFKNL